MLRSLYSGISGLRAHQIMLDVTGNNIANVNTTGFKASATQFQDTLSQMTQAAGAPQSDVGGTNPAQVGLGVYLTGITTNFSQGSAQATGRGTDLMISGDGFFITERAGETLYTRSGAFDFDAQGRLVTPDGAIVQGWPAEDGVVAVGGPISDVTLPQNAVTAPVQTTTAIVAGNIPSDTADGAVLTRDVETFDSLGDPTTLTLTFTMSGGSWNVGTDGGPANLVFDANGNLTSPLSVVADGITVDLAKVTGFADLTTISVTDQNGRAAGTIQSYTLSEDGTLVGSFSNGATEALARIALANFANAAGLEKAGSSAYRATFNSGIAAIAAPGTAGVGALISSALEMSNVDLSQEFTNLIVAQRGFQSNARIITTSDEVLQELANLKR